MKISKMNNIPEFKIHGLQRKHLKKELSALKSYVKNFWHYHQLDKDMCSFYGGTNSATNGGANTYPMDDNTAQQKFDLAIIKIKDLENILSIKY